MSKETLRHDSCPLIESGQATIDRFIAYGMSDVAADTEVGLYSAMALCGSVCTLNSLCLVRNPDKSDASDELALYQKIFSAAERFGEHADPKCAEVEVVLPHPRYSNRY